MNDTQSAARLETVDTYLAILNEPDAQKRAALIERAWAPDGRYVDPMYAVEGRDGLSALAAGVHAKYPGHRFRRVSGVDAHHDVLRFAWELAAPDGSVLVGGIDVGELDASGRLRRITGFFGALPEKR